MPDYVCEVQSKSYNGKPNRNWNCVVEADTHQQAAERVILSHFEKGAKVTVREIKPERGKGYWIEKRAVVTTEVVLVD